MTPMKVQANAEVAVSVTMPLRHLCPFKSEVDQGEVTLTWNAMGSTLELHSVREWLDGYANHTVSHEDLTGILLDTLIDLELGGLSVTTRWETAGGTVTVTA